MARDPLLTRIRDALTALYGDNIDRVARVASDYDIAVFLKTLADHQAEWRRRGELRYEIMAETGRFFDLLPFAAEAYHQRAPLMWDIRGQGCDL